MLLGTYKHSLDNKKRLIIPAKIVAKLGKEVVVSKGFEGCLELRTKSEFESYSQKLLKLSQNKKEARILIRQLLANAVNLSIDSANRILIPDVLLDETSIKIQTTIIGLGDKLEIWDTNSYNEFKKLTDKTYEDIAERIDDNNDNNM